MCPLGLLLEQHHHGFYYYQYDDRIRPPGQRPTVAAAQAVDPSAATILYNNSSVVTKQLGVLQMDRNMIGLVCGGSCYHQTSLKTYTNVVVVSFFLAVATRQEEAKQYLKDATTAEVDDGTRTTITTSASGTSDSNNDEEANTVSIMFVQADESEKVVQAPIGKHLLEVAHDNDVELEGACGGELACSTCHLIFEQKIYDQLPPMLDDEVDMLDLAFGVTET